MYLFYTRSIITFSFLMLISLNSIGQNIFDEDPQGLLVKHLSFYSDILKQDVSYSIYFPSGYYDSDKRYPVLYILHGHGGNVTTLLRNNIIVNKLDSLIYNKIILPFIFIMPSGYNTYFINDHLNNFRYEDMFIEELIPFIDNTYKTYTSRYSRGISGISMGGFGSIILTMKHPEIFGHCLANSAAIRNDSMIINASEKRWNESYSILFGENLIGEERITEHWKNTNPLYFVSQENAKIFNTINWYIDCGSEDYLYLGNLSLDLLFFQYNINYYFISFSGGHNWLYWNKSIERTFLQFGQYINTLPSRDIH